ncbi:hypothetical protein AB205_0148170 [Aquarana catesbeiana]|uniref:Uncharacterized protein n=1 Tax=Aquarana catesbeiana TaxID=8400 RepID=A0A2G9S5N5_AQUCT|nr:hypothetical protein AB205_0148170 [Aquarana catesbeiana]
MNTLYKEFEMSVLEKTKKTNNYGISLANPKYAFVGPNILYYHRMEQDIFLSSDELDDDVFYPDDFGFPVQPLTPSAMFTHSPSYTCMLGRFQLFPLSHCCGPGCRITDCEDKATQTLEPSSYNRDIMLPCGVAESPQRLFYGQ